MNNIGAITKIIIHEIDPSTPDLSPNAAGIVSLSDLTIVSSNKLLFTQESADCSVKESETAQGSQFEIAVKFRIPRISPEVFADIIRFKYFVLEITDANSQGYLIGNASTPVKSITNKIIPAKTSGYNGREFTFTSSQGHDILYL